MINNITPAAARRTPLQAAQLRDQPLVTVARRRWPFSLGQALQGAHCRPHVAHETEYKGDKCRSNQHGDELDAADKRLRTTLTGQKFCGFLVQSDPRDEHIAERQQELNAACERIRVPTGVSWQS